MITRVTGLLAPIGIIGAGASGLAAAHALRRAGYRSVTVLERADHVGGKCHTFPFEGRSYELGAGAFTSAYTNVRSLMDEVGVRAVAGVGGVFNDLEAGRTSILPPPLRDHAPWRLGVETVRLGALLWRAAELRRPGFAGLPSELAEPFSAWARHRRLEGVAALIEPWFTGFGYGYLDEVPAAFVLKYATLFRFPVAELLDVGYQGLWERVAARLDVRLGVHIRAIVRSEQEVSVTIDRGDRGEVEQLRFAALIVTCPPDDALRILDASEEERALLSRPAYNDYRVIAAVVDGAPRARYGFIQRHLSRDHAGEVIFWYRRWSDRDLVLYYSLAPPGMSMDETEARTRATVGRMGGRVTRIHTRHAWRYFPHVDTATIRSGYYERFDALQGQRRTYYAGEILAFSTVETVVAYARALVAKHFPTRGAG